MDKQANDNQSFLWINFERTIKPSLAINAFICALIFYISYKTWSLIPSIALTSLLTANLILRSKFHSSRTDRCKLFASDLLSAKTLDHKRTLSFQFASSNGIIASVALMPWVPTVLIVISYIALSRYTGFTTSGILASLPSVIDLFSGFAHPQWDLLNEAITVYATQTLSVAILGTALGFVLSVPFSVLCANNLMSNNPFIRFIYVFVRLIMSSLRSLPTFLLGLIFVALVGVGSFPGVLAITLFSVGVMVKLFSESIESIDNGPLMAVQSCGGGWVSTVRFAVAPQVYPMFLANLLYCFEINVHSATVLGLIGAEGIGLPISEYLSSLNYGGAAVYIFVVIAMTLIVDSASAIIRKQIS